MSGSRAGAHAGWKTKSQPIQVGIDCQPFYIPRCENHRCRAPLTNAQGEPRWDLMEDRFVCLGSCYPGDNRG